MSEPWQVNGHQMGVLSELPPRRFEGQQALRPRAEQEGALIAMVLAYGEPDCQPVDDPESHFERCVHPGGHAALLIACAGGCIPVIVTKAGPGSSPPDAQSQWLVVADRARQPTAD